MQVTPDLAHLQLTMSLRNASARLAPTGDRIALHLHMTDVTRDAGAIISLIGLDDANSAAVGLHTFVLSRYVCRLSFHTCLSVRVSFCFSCRHR